MTIPALAPDPMPNATPFELLNVNALAFVLVVPAERLMLLIVAALDCIAVVRNAGTARFSPAVLCVPAITAPPAVVVVNPVKAKLLEAFRAELATFSMSVITLTLTVFAIWSPTTIALDELLSCARTIVQLSPDPLLVTRIISELESVSPVPVGQTVQLKGAAGKLAPSPVATVRVVPLVAGLGAVAIVL